MTRHRPGGIPVAQSAIIGANVRVLCLGRGWTMAKLGELMGWTAESTVCAAEGHRSSWQRKFTTGEIELLAAIFDVSPEQLNTRCVNCGGQPPTGFACLACGTASPNRSQLLNRKGRTPRIKDQ
jgi:hypothetical protein